MCSGKMLIRILRVYTEVGSFVRLHADLAEYWTDNGSVTSSLKKAYPSYKKADEYRSKSQDLAHTKQAYQSLHVNANQLTDFVTS